MTEGIRRKTNQKSKCKRQNYNAKITKFVMAPVAVVCSTPVESILQIGPFMQNKANRRPLAGNPKHEILNLS
jgi:hypothetical protein